MSTQQRKAAPRAEIERMADLLARNARLNDPLPPGTDFSPEGSKAVQDQLNALAILPHEHLHYLYLAFSAKYLAALVHALRAANRETQRRAVSTYIQILSLLPDPKGNPYLRRYLRSPRAAGLPNLVADHFVKGIDWLRPSGPGDLCTLHIHFLFYCDTQMGDDKRASIDKALRDALAGKLADLSAQPDFSALPELQRVEVQRLMGILNVLEQMPADYYLKSTQDHLLGSISGQEECDVCMDDDAEMLCSQCKAVRYCSKECQMKAWKEGHKRNCWKMLDGTGKDF
ncbi:zinc finger MYND domain-containing protein [Phanerochaete sordida]|uniref:Zinc finger MYND domain-containing protein n=1 Tax=Phanerochaete sordida TaxID=48140 RepID=A0A9P3LHY5_9APHY|nr:zinc finger MYND domain-containing protein [Phanerochaete sordida]